MFADRPLTATSSQVDFALNLARQRRRYESGLRCAKAPHEISYCRGALYGVSRCARRHEDHAAALEEALSLDVEGLFHKAVEDPLLLRAMTGRKNLDDEATQPFYVEFTYNPLRSSVALSTIQLCWFLEGYQYAVSAAPQFRK